MSAKRVCSVLLALFLIAVVSSVAAAAATPKPRVAVVAVDRIGDRGFTDSAYEGLVRAAKELGIQYKVFECKTDPSVYYERILAAAENFDLVFIDPGYFFDKELKEIVPKFPKVTFVYIDGVTDLPGVVSVNFKEEQGSFLAGALAGLMSSNESLKKGKPNRIVGFVGGADWPVIRNFQTGYEQGVRYVDAKVKVISIFAGTHYDPAKGKETALEANKKGASIIFQAAGPTGLGVLEAARDADFYVIGVDIDQCGAQPGHIMASMLKRVDNAVFDITKRYIDGKLTRGGSYPYGVKEGGVGLCDCKYMKEAVPADVRAKLESLERQLAAGQITVKEYSAK